MLKKGIGANPPGTESHTLECDLLGCQWWRGRGWAATTRKEPIGTFGLSCPPPPVDPSGLVFPPPPVHGENRCRCVLYIGRTRWPVAYRGMQMDMAHRVPCPSSGVCVLDHWATMHTQ